MTDKLNQEIKIKAKQVTEDLINFMQDLDTENNYQIKELDFGCDIINNSISIRADKNNVEFTIVGEYYGDYTQYFECNVCLDDIPFILNGEKSLWDFNPNTEEYRF